MPSVPKTLGIAGGTGLLAGGGGYLYGGTKGLEQGRREGYQRGYERGVVDARRQAMMAPQVSSQSASSSKSDSGSNSAPDMGEKNAFVSQLGQRKTAAMSPYGGAMFDMAMDLNNKVTGVRQAGETAANWKELGEQVLNKVRGGGSAADDAAEEATEEAADSAISNSLSNMGDSAQRIQNLGIGAGAGGVGTAGFMYGNDEQGSRSANPNYKTASMNSFLNAAGKESQTNRFVKRAETPGAKQQVAQQVAAARRSGERGESIGGGIAGGTVLGAGGGALAADALKMRKYGPAAILAGAGLGALGGGYVGEKLAPQTVAPNEVSVNRQGEGMYQARYPEGRSKDIRVVRSPMGGYEGEVASTPGPSNAPRNPTTSGPPLRYTENGSPTGRAEAMGEDVPNGSDSGQSETKQASEKNFLWVEKTAEPPQKALAQHAGQGPTTKRKHPAGQKSEGARQKMMKILFLKMLRARQQRKKQQMQSGPPQKQEGNSSEEATSGSDNAGDSSEDTFSENGSSENGSEDNSSGEEGAEKEAKKTCPHCGGEITDEGKCPECGEEVSPEKEASLPDDYLLTDMTKAAAAEGAFGPNDDCGCGEKTADDSSDSDPCWDGYEQIGMKTKNGKEVPNCVPKDDSKEGAKTADDSSDSDPCWDGYKQVGMKTKDGNKVPNCVPKDDSEKNSSTYGTYARAFAPTGSPVYLPPETSTSEKIAQAYDQGKINEEEAAYLAGLKEAMEKNAANMDKTAAGAIGKGIEMVKQNPGPALLAAGLAAGPVASGVSKAIDPIRERVRYNRMKELPGQTPRLVDPDSSRTDIERRNAYGIGKEVPAQEANERARRQAFSILHEHAPEMTKSPTVARAAVKENLNKKNPMDLLDDAAKRSNRALERRKNQGQMSSDRARAIMDAAQAVQ